MRSAHVFLPVAVLAVLLLPAGSLSQSASLRVDYSAPTAASLGRFSDVPVNLHTGLPDISIPLFEVQGRTLGLPIVLRYHGGGVRVEEVGSWVGLGWALEAGGMITRTVRGLVDESTDGYLNTGHVFYQGSNWQAPSSALLINIRNGYVDGEPDLYSFNFAGRSGQFVFGPTSSVAGVWQARTIPHQRLRIEPTLSGNQITSWEITTEDGTRYTFAAAETTTDWSIYADASLPPSYGTFHKSSWHLTRIRVPGGDEITLHYTPYTAEHKIHAYQERREPRTGPFCPQADFGIFGHDQVEAQRLDSIRSAVHTIRFTTTMRSDALSPSGAPQEPRLDRISIRTPDGTELKRFQFDHDYFPGNRLRLRNVFEQSAGGTSLPPWTFAYNGQTLPALSSKSQDHWGYWNGKSNSTLVPRLVLENGTVLAGADREPDTTRTKVGSLTRITYPTGGYSEFVWQSHAFGRRPEGPIYDLGPGKMEQLLSSGFDGLKTKPLVIGGAAPVSVHVTVSIAPDGCQPWEPCPNYVGIAGYGTWNASTTQTLTLSPGTYTLQAYSAEWDGHAHIQVSWQEWVSVKSKPAGGLRIAEIQTGDGAGNTQVRRFQYSLQAHPDSSSGVLRATPRYDWTQNSPDCGYLTRASISKMPLGGGAAVTYREVTVLDGPNGEFGRTREVLRTFLDAPDAVPPDWPYHRVTSNDWKRGQRVESRVASSNGAVQRRLRTEHVFLENANFTRFRGLSLHSIVASMSAQDWYYPYEVVSGWTYAAADTTHLYNEGGTGGFSTVTTYEYGNLDHLQLTRITETNSDGRQRITRMKYPADYASGSGNLEAVALTAMKGSTVHMHSAVIERWVIEKDGANEKVVQADLTTFRANGGRYLPYQRFTLNAASPPTDFVPSSVTSGSFTKDSRHALQETANTYDAYGRVTQLTDARGKVTNYLYGGNPNNAFLTKVTRVKDGTGTVDLVTDLAYHSTGYLASIRDEGGTFRRFTYDAYGRLSEVRNHGSLLVEAYAYAYSRTSGNGWVYQSASPNRITTTTHLSGTASVEAREYLDGLGRPIQTNVRDGSTYHVTATQYDLMGRPWRVWKPYPRTSSAYDASFASNATAHYNTYLGVSNAKPYAETQYTADPLSRVKKEIPEYTGSSATVFRQYAYTTNTTAKQVLTELTDELGKKRRTHTDLFGQDVRIVLGAGTSDSTSTSLLHDVVGRRTRATDPRGIQTNYTVNTRGVLETRTNPDAGNRSHKYDQAGNLRFTQDANQAAAGQVLFTSYDFAGRPLVTGVGDATFSSLDPNVTASFENTQANWRVVHRYDAKPTNVFPWSRFWTQINPLTLTNVGGRLAAVASESNGAWQVTLFGYDADGRVSVRHTFTEANGGASVLTALNTTTTYVRDRRGELTERRMTVGTSTWNQWYDHDGRGLLWKVSGSTGTTKPATPDVTYTYRPGGLPASRQFMGGTTVPVTYTIREQLHRIGDPATTTHRFSARYAYHANGTVSESEFYNAGTPTAAGATKRYKYAYGTASYDALNRLKSADFSSWSGSAWTSTLAHDLTNITYDRSGNLRSLRRYPETGTLIDRLGYAYPSGSNRLTSVTDTVPPTDEPWDAESGSFTHDANGNVKTSPAPYSLTAATYDHMNLPLSFTRGGSVTTVYRYDQHAQRIAKRVGSGNTEVYLREGPLTLAVFTVNGSGVVQSHHFNVVSGQRVVGRRLSAGGRRYYHTDLLGSTRTVTDSLNVVKEAYDYDPWGVLMPGRTLGSGTKEGFTGKERDAETGLDYFGFRYYMAAIGRWTSVDPPADSFPEWSPYNYVEGNPTSLWDLLGLFADTLRYNGSRLTLIGDDGAVRWTGRAYSGRAGSTPADQAVPWMGPIPEGTYSLDPGEISEVRGVRRILRNLGGDWGTYRAPLHPSAGTETHGRSGFFLHGGSVPGSAGCIDVCELEHQLFPLLQQHEGLVTVIVEYSDRLTPTTPRRD